MSPAKSKDRFFVGSYTQKNEWIPNAGGEGIATVQLDPLSGSLTCLSHNPAVKNPSYLALTGKKNRLLACSERFNRNGAAYLLGSINNGAASVLSKSGSYGKATCHIAYDAATKRVYAPSYLSSNMAIFEISPAGKLQFVKTITYHGSGPSKRQRCSHPHQALFWKDSVFVPDLGSDCIWIHSRYHTTDRPVAHIKTPVGSGPRHMVFHPTRPIFYVVCELQPKVLIYLYNESEAKGYLLAELPTDEDHRLSLCAPAAIKWHPHSLFFAVSNRGANTLALFSVSRRAKVFELRGNGPRDFTFSNDGKWLLIPFQDSHELIAYRVEKPLTTPDIAEADSLRIDSPACIIAAP